MPYGERETVVHSSTVGPTKFFTNGVIALLLLMVIGCILTAYARDFTTAFLALSHGAVRSGAFWQLLTYPLVNSAASVVTCGFVVLFFGSAIEREWRTLSFLLLIAIVTAACGVLWCAVNYLLERISDYSAVGMGAAVWAYGIIGAYGLIFRGRRYMLFVWTMQAQHIALLMVAIGALMAIQNPIDLIWVSAAGVAWMCVRLIWRVQGLTPRRARSATAEVSRFKDLG